VVFTQVQEECSIVIGAKKNYSSAKLECSCVMWVEGKKGNIINALHPIWLSLHIVTDSSTSRTRRANQRCEMKSFEHDVTHRRGAENIADYFSRQNGFAGVMSTRIKRKNQK